jgi:outer membrane biosynthesis protein TonB
LSQPLVSPNLLLPWYSSEDEDRSFKKILRNFFIAFLVLTPIVYFYPVPEKTREEKEIPPPDLARVILEKKELPKPPPPKPKPEPKKPEPKPEPKKPEPKPKPPEPKPKPEPKPPEPKPKPKPVVKAPPKKVEPTQQQKLDAAKQQATAEINQLQDALAGMRNLSVDTNVNNLAQGDSTAKQNDRSVITSQAKAKSGGINTAKLSRSTGGQALSGRQSTQVDSSLARRKAAEDAKRRTGTGADGRQIVSRSEESIRKIIDRNKAAIDTTYQRALRKNPSLEGRFVVKLVIEPSGQVSSASIVTSDLSDPDLEKKLLTRIRLLNFGVAAVARTTVNYTFDFFPQ